MSKIFGSELSGDPHARIADTDPNLVRAVRPLAAGFGDEPDVPTLRRELAGIVQQIHQHLRQANRIAIECHGVVGQRNRQDVTRSIDAGSAQFDCGVDEVCQFEPFLAQLDFPLRDA